VLLQKASKVEPVEMAGMVGAMEVGMAEETEVAGAIAEMLATVEVVMLVVGTLVTAETLVAEMGVVAMVMVEAVNPVPVIPAHKTLVA